MARERYRVVICRDCGNEIAEPPFRSGFPAERLPCPNCGGTAREYRLGLAASVGVSGEVAMVVETPEPGGAKAGGFEPTEIIEEATTTETHERTVVYSKNPDAWLAEVRDADGNLLGVELGLDADNVYLDLRDLLGPP